MRLVVDTNVALDLLVFNEPAHALKIAPLRQALQSGRLAWLSCAPMREELQRVLHYPKLLPRVLHYGHTPESVLAAHDRLAQPLPTPPKATWTCSDPDDQVYIDLAVAHSCVLLSKDRAVLAMRRRLARAGVCACTPDAFMAEA